LRNIFVGCQSLKYYPGRDAHFIQGESTKIPDDKILSGYVKVSCRNSNNFIETLCIVVFYRYAFLQYSNFQQANDVVENSDQYRINGQPLYISFHTKKKSLRSMT